MNICRFDGMDTAIFNGQLYLLHICNTFKLMRLTFIKLIVARPVGVIPKINNPSSLHHVHEVLNPFLLLK